jgi:hypothetical protein
MQRKEKSRAKLMYHRMLRSVHCDPGYQLLFLKLLPLADGVKHVPFLVRSTGILEYRHIGDLLHFMKNTQTHRHCKTAPYARYGAPE